MAKYWYNLSKEVGRNNVMIVSLDKDYMQFPALIYNYHYNHKKVYDITEQEALYNRLKSEGLECRLLTL